MEPDAIQPCRLADTTPRLLQVSEIFASLASGDDIGIVGQATGGLQDINRRRAQLDSFCSGFAVGEAQFGFTQPDMRPLERLDFPQPATREGKQTDGPCRFGHIFGGLVEAAS
ncbi:hypothetical protein KRIGEM_03323 [Komagataeibacter rhaeticus]|nr:hypothetical protein KRIGEM_03323 [Komagataeibacter rhaeticus]